MTLTRSKIEECRSKTKLIIYSGSSEEFARAIEQLVIQESQAKITDLENRLEGSQARVAELEKEIERLWKDTKGITQETGEAWLTPRMKNEAKKLEEELSQSPAPVSETPAKTKLGKRLLELRQSAIDDGMELLTRDQILEPIASHAGEVGQALKQWNGLSADEVGKFVNDICEYGTDFVSPLFAVIENVEITLQRRNSAPHQPSKEQVREAFNKFEIEAVAYGASQNMSSKKMDAAKAELLALLQSQPKQSTGSEG